MITTDYVQLTVRWFSWVSIFGCSVVDEGYQSTDVTAVCLFRSKHHNSHRPSQLSIDGRMVSAIKEVVKYHI